MKKTLKKHDSCVRVLEFLKMLFNDDILIKDITQKDNSQFRDIEAPETFLKYICTLEFLGFDIKKIGKKYSLQSYMPVYHLEDEDLELLTELYKSFDEICLENERENFEKIVQNIIKSLEYPVQQKLTAKIRPLKERALGELSKKAEFFKKYIDLKQKIKIKYNGKFIIAEPQDIQTENKRIQMLVFDCKNRCNTWLSADKIENIEVLPGRVGSKTMPNTIVFEVYDRLAVNYRLRENEHIQTFDDNKKVVVNKGEDKKSLIRRLMKYGENCKIISPNPFKESFLEELNLIENKMKEAVK